MADSATRARLEDTQVDIRRLKAELAEWPPISEERRGMRDQNFVLDTELSRLNRQLTEAQSREVELRDRGDLSSAWPWWRSAFAPLTVAMAVIGGWVWVNRAVLEIDWYHWAPRLSPWLLAVPPVVNFARWAWAYSRRRSSG